MHRRLALVVLPVTAVAAFGITSVASAAPFGLSATALRGANEVPGPGDEDGTGRAIASPRAGQGQMCISIRYADIDAPTAAHIHEGPPDVAGPVVIDFGPLIASSPAGQIKGCVDADPALVRDVAQNPHDYYVNVHNEAFPAGAIRGQLRG